jgi:N-acetylmuramoyl-L-alanine amidase
MPIAAMEDVTDTIDVTMPYPTPTPLPSPTPPPTATPDPNLPAPTPEATAAAATVAAEVPAQPTPAPTPQGPTAVIGTGANVNVRRGPGTSYRVLGDLGRNEVVPIIGKSGDGNWLQIQIGNIVGWIATKVVEVTGDLASLAVTDGSGGSGVQATGPTDSAASIVVPRGDVVNVRQGPSTGTGVTFKLRGGQSASITGQNAEGDWWQIDYRGTTGWVYRTIVVANGDTSKVPIIR